MYWRFVVNAMRLRAARLSLAFAALSIAAALATALFGVYADVERRVSAEFSSYGANLTIASPGLTPTVPLDAVAKARRAGASAAAPWLFVPAKIAGEPVTLAGVDLDAARELTRFWHVEGERGPCLAGTNLAQRFHLASGSPVALEGAPCQLSGIVSTGGHEDNELILPFAVAAKLAGVQNVATLIEVRVAAAQLHTLESELRSALPQVDVRPIQAIAVTETNVVTKIRVVLFLLLALILVITTMSVTSSFSELVMERRHEIGILKAIGAVERKVASLFLTESIFLALASAATGYLAGIVLAGWIGRSVFNAPFTLHVQISVLLSATLMTLAVALAATAMAGVSIWRIQPARILRGE